MTDRNLSALVPWRRRIAGVAVLATLATVALYLSLTRRSSDMAAPWRSWGPYLAGRRAQDDVPIVAEKPIHTGARHDLAAAL